MGQMGQFFGWVTGRCIFTHDPPAYLLKACRHTTQEESGFSVLQMELTFNQHLLHGSVFVWVSGSWVTLLVIHCLLCSNDAVSSRVRE